MATSNPKAGLGVLGVGAAACAACCAGPILGFLAATGIASVLGAAVFGIVGLLIVLAVAAVLYQRRRDARRCEPATTGPVPLDAPQLKTRRRDPEPAGPGRPSASCWSSQPGCSSPKATPSSPASAAPAPTKDPGKTSHPPPQEKLP